MIRNGNGCFKMESCREISIQRSSVKEEQKEAAIHLLWSKDVVVILLYRRVREVVCDDVLNTCYLQTDTCNQLN